MNKKAIFLTAVTATTLLLAGCGANTGTVKSDMPDPAKLIKKTATKMQEQQNVHMDIDTKMKAGSENLVLLIKSDFNFKPIEMLGDYTIKVGDDAQKMKMYLSEKTLYMNLGGSWQDATSSLSSTGLNLEDLEKQANGSKVADLPKKLQESAEITEAKGKYVVKLSASGKEAKKVINEGLATADIPGSKEIDVDVSSLKYTYTVDKKTSLPTKLILKMKMKVQGETINEVVTSTFSDWNSANVKKPALTE